MSTRSPNQRRRGRVRARVIQPLREFLQTEVSGGVILFIATVTALVWANSPLAGSYEKLWHLELGGGSYRLELHEWVADGLMTVFFFVVGLEIKRELVVGELRELQKAALPVIAAVGGMVGPAAIYLLLNGDGPARRGWGIPVATDIAFAVGILALLGKRVPDGLKVFVVALAIVDDIAGIIVIAVFYTDDLSLVWLGAGLAVFALVPAMRTLGARQPLLYVPLGMLAWAALYRSGVHPTIAGVVMGMLTPARPFRGRKVLEDLEHLLHPSSSYVIVPLFALASAGVVLNAEALRSALVSDVFWGIALGLFVGKTAGISLATALAVRLRIGRLPDAVSAAHVVGAAAIAGMGFTVALFMARLAFAGTELGDVAKVGILAGSLTSAITGALVLMRTGRPRRARPER